MLAQAMPKPIIGTNNRYLLPMCGKINKAAAASESAKACTCLAE